MLSVSCIGLGNAGNQIAELANTMSGIPGIAINSSRKDLTNVKNKNIEKLVVGDTKGAGKDRSTARQFIKEQIKPLLQKEEFLNLIIPHDVIFVVSSIGGGTGSGMAPIMTDILMRKFPSKIFVLVEVWPPLRESLAAQQNGIDYLKEVQENIPNCVYMAFDNNKLSHLPTSEMMKQVNMEIVEAMNIIKGEFLYDTPYNSIDEKDMLRIINTPGRLAIYHVDDIKEKDLDNEDIEDKLINVIKNQSTNVELDRDKIIKRLGVIHILNNKLNNILNGDLPKIKDLIGEEIESFEHAYVTEDNSETNRFIVICSGLSVPDDRLLKAKQRIDDGLADLQRREESSILKESDTSEIKDLRTEEMCTGDSFNLDDIFGKYDN